MSADSPVADRARLARIQRRFGEFAAEYAALPLYAALCRELARDDEAAALLLAARPGQARPVLWLAAVHELVLRNPDSPAAQWYPSVVGRDVHPRPVIPGRTSGGQSWSTATSSSNASPPTARRRTRSTAPSTWRWVSRPRPSTGRTVPWRSWSSARARGCCSVSTGMPSSSPHPGTGCSSAIPPRRCGVRGSTAPVSAFTSPSATLGLPAVRGRVGLDVAPVDLDDDEAVRWLEACLWPEVPGRIERFRSARDLVRRDPPHILRGDMIEGLPHAAERARALSGPDAHVVVLSSWALTYLDPTRRHELVSRLRSLAHDVPDLTLLSAEPPGCVPGVPVPDGAVEGGTVIGLSRWRSDVELAPVALGTCHPHGAWIDVDPSAIDALAEIANSP